jgi:zinc/manganese transport system substrate-binding protein
MPFELRAMMLKTTSLLLLGLLLSAPAAWAEVRIVACEPEWAALAALIGGDRVTTDAATTGLQDVHYIQARPSLIAKVRRADLLVCTGAGLESGWLPILLRQSGNPHVQPGDTGFLEASRYVEMLEIPTSVDRSEGDVHPFGNPHIQTDPRNMLPVADALLERFVLLDPAGAEDYRRRHAEFAQQWGDALADWTERGSSLAGMPIVTHHKSWVYLVHWLDLDEVATLESKPGIEPSAGHLARVLESVEGRDVRVIIRTSYQNARASDWLSARTGAPAVVLPHTVGSVEGTDDLFSLYETMLATLERYAQ